MYYKIEWTDTHVQGWTRALEGGLEHEVTRLLLKGATTITITEGN